jgi:hypothetical protein
MNLFPTLRKTAYIMTLGLVAMSCKVHANGKDMVKKPNFVRTNSGYTYKMSSPYGTYNKPLYALQSRQNKELVDHSIYAGFWGQASFRWTDSNQAGASAFSTLRGNTKQSASRFAVGYASLSFTANVGDWIATFTDLVYSPEDFEGVSAQRVQLTLGNLDKSPIYASIGKGYIPYGCQDSLNQINRSFFSLVFLPAAQSMTLGYFKNGFDVTVSAARSSTDNSNSGFGRVRSDKTNIDSFVINSRYAGECDACDWFVGAGYNNNSPFNFERPTELIVQGKNAAWDLNAGVTWEKLTFQAEYLFASDKYLANTTNVNAKKPYAYQVQGAYDFIFADYDHKASVSYSGLELSKQISAVNNISDLNITLATHLNSNFSSFVAYDYDKETRKNSTGMKQKLKDNRVRLGVRAVF